MTSNCTARAHRQFIVAAKQSDNCKGNASEPLPRRCFVKKHNPRDGHDRRATGQNRRHGRKWTTLLKKKKECDCARADADAGKNGKENSLRTGLLIPTARQPKKCEIN